MLQVNNYPHAAESILADSRLLSDLIDNLDLSQQHSQHARKLAFAICLVLLHHWRGQSRPASLSPIFEKYFYQAGGLLFFSYDVLQQAESSYVSQKKLANNLQEDPNNVILMYFVPIKFLSSDKVYLLSRVDLDRICSNKSWASLPDPKNCYCWIRISSNTKPADKELSASQEMVANPHTISSKNSSDSRELSHIPVPEGAALTVFRRQFSLTAGNSRSRSRGDGAQSPGPSRFGNYQRRGTTDLSFQPIQASGLNLTGKGLQANNSVFSDEHVTLRKKDCYLPKQESFNLDNREQQARSYSRSEESDQPEFSSENSQSGSQAFLHPNNPKNDKNLLNQSRPLSNLIADEAYSVSEPRGTLVSKIRKYQLHVNSKVMQHQTSAETA